MKAHRRAVAHGLALCALLAASGCELIAGLDGDYQLDPTLASGCDPLHPPDKPKPAGAGGGDETFTVAFRKVDLGETDTTPRLGFDLDDACSCTFDAQTCAPPSWVDKNKPVCDGARGVDNGASVALKQANTLAAGALSSALISEGASAGMWSLLLRVKGFSGMPNDEQVEVAVFLTPGLGAMPSWNGTDAWPVADSSVNMMSLDMPLVVDTAAYVRDGALVAHLPEMQFMFRGTTVQLPVKVGAVTLSAQILLDSSAGFSLREGTIGGKWRLDEVFKSLAGLRYGGDKQICRETLEYSPVKGFFCRATDIRYGDATPNADGSLPQCNAISFGMHFEAEPAQLGAVVPAPPPPPDTCAESPATDNCK